MPRRTHSLHPTSSALTGRDTHPRRSIYGVDGWARLDRVQELGDDLGNSNEGHTGCVNALSWSDDGGILLSGSDDKRICIWTPDSDPSSPAAEQSPHPFKLSERIITGHRANIFSARFLPHANTPTIVSCAGDGDIRVFDIDRLSTSETDRRSSNHLWGVEGPGVQVLRCHENRTKRIATQGSPNLFLSVSEDGTVRQHDLRKPHECRIECPPPLFRAPPGVDLYSLSLSPLAPHIFAVAGQTDCAYICDRRMMARQSPSWGSQIHRASQVYCVRRLGLPDSEWESVGSKTRTHRERHITCVKMSEDNADEVICAFAMHSTSLFSLSEDPAESSARVKNGSALPPNPDSNTAKGEKKRTPKKRSKRRLSNLAQDSRPASRARTDDGGEDDDDIGEGRDAQFLRSEDSSRIQSPHPIVAHMEGIVANMEEHEREHLEDLASDLIHTLYGPDGSSSSRGSSPNGEEGDVTNTQARRPRVGPDTPPRRVLPEWDVGSDEEEIDLAQYQGDGNNAAEGRGEGTDAAIPTETGHQDSPLVDLRRAQNLTDYLAARGLTDPTAEDGDDGDEETDDEDEDADEEEDEMDLDDFDGEDDFGDLFDEDDMPFYHSGALSKDGQFRDVDMLYPTRMYRGARNMDTVKDCNFLGDASDKVCSGSDDGMFFVWDKKTGKLQGIWNGDEEIVNVMEQHPTLPIVAVSGIENTVKIFAPTATPPRPSYSCTDKADYIIERNRYRPSFRPAHQEPTAIQLLTSIMARPDGSLPLDLVQYARGIYGDPGVDNDDEMGQPQCPTQ